MLHSSKAIGKETATIPWRPGRTPPDPRLGSHIELSRRNTGGLLDLFGIGKALPSERIAAEEAPPALLQVEPARPSGNEDVMDARMLLQPRAGLEAGMAAEIVGDDEDISSRIVGFDVGERSDVALGIARGCTARQYLAIAHPQCSIDPGFLGSAPVVHRSLDAVSIRRPAWSRVKRAGNDRAEFVSANGRRSLGWLGLVGDDRRSFETKSLSRGVPQLWVCRHLTPSRSRMRRIWLRLTRMPASLAASASASRLHWADPLSSRATIVPSSCVTRRPGGGLLGKATMILRSASLSRGLRPEPLVALPDHRCLVG